MSSTPSRTEDLVPRQVVDHFERHELGLDPDRQIWPSSNYWPDPQYNPLGKEVFWALVPDRYKRKP